MEDFARVAPRKRRRQKKKKATAAAAVATLPDDVVLEILARAADDDAALFRCAVSCKRWRALVADPSFLRRRWPEGARDPGSLLGFFQTTWKSRLTPFVPVPRSPLGPGHRLLSSFFPNDGGLLHDAVPLASRSGLLLVRLRSWHISFNSVQEWTDIDQGLVRLAVCNPLARTWDELPPLHHGSQVMSEYAILTDEDHCPKGRLQKRLPSYTTLFKVIIIMVAPHKVYTFSSAESSWSTPARCFEHIEHREYDFVHGNPVVSQGKIHWLLKGSGNFRTLEFCVETDHVSIIQFPIAQDFFEYNFYHGPVLNVAVDGKLSLICLHKKFLRLQIFTHQGDEGGGNGVADTIHTEVTELKHKAPPNEALYMYVGEKSATLLVTHRRKFVCIVNLETGKIDEVTDMSRELKGPTVVPFEIDWPAFFVSSLEDHLRHTVDPYIV
ncbi:hypothetical protein VPH35_016549 [Triticum aestivum]